MFGSATGMATQVGERKPRAELCSRVKSNLASRPGGAYAKTNRRPMIAGTRNWA